MSELHPIDKMMQSVEFLQGVAELMNPDLEITHAGRRALGWMLDELQLHIRNGIEALKQCHKERQER